MRVEAQLLLTFLLNAAWQIAVVVALAAACDWVLRGTTARYRHGLWVAALLMALALPLLSSAGLIRIYSGSKIITASPEIIAAPRFVTSISSPDLDSVEPAAAERAVPAAAERERQGFLRSPIHLNWNLAAAIVACYGLFLFYRIGKFIRAWQRTKRIIQSAVTFEETETVAAIIKSCRAAIGVDRVRLLVSASVPVPITVGIFSPLIILPAHLLHDIDEEVLTTAIGHELVHVARRDYLANLIYELIYLPLSFHPALALVRRRIKQTRELCCDESVATKLMRAETYARSLVRLIGSAPLGPRLAADTAIGISESDILEVRIMTLLKTTKLTARRKRLLLITAALLLVAPCVAATSFALTLDFERQEPPPMAGAENTNRQKQARERDELKSAVRELKEKAQAAPASQRAEAEARLMEAERNLELHERLLRESDTQREAREKRTQELQERLAKIQTQYPGDEAQVKELREKLAEINRQESTAEMQSPLADRKARVIYRVEPEYPLDARAKQIEGTVVLTLTIDHEGLPQNIQVKRPVYPSVDQSAIEAARKMRFEPAMKNGQPASQTVSVEFKFAIESRTREEIEEIEKRAAEERANSGDAAVREMKIRRDPEQQNREERARTQAELTRGAVLSMDRAIQIATSQVPGKVLACSLGRDGDKVFYHVVIISGDGDKSMATYVWVSAVDGQILKTEKEERRQEREEEAAIETARPPISAGVLNDKASSLPQPAFPAIAKAAHASGAVTVEIVVDENGQVVAAHAVAGHPLLQAAAVTAARQASFKPTRLNGEPVRVAGVLIYDFGTP
jgi:TonB family protein